MKSEHLAKNSKLYSNFRLKMEEMEETLALVMMIEDSLRMSAVT